MASFLVHTIFPRLFSTKFEFAKIPSTTPCVSASNFGSEHDVRKESENIITHIANVLFFINKSYSVTVDLAVEVVESWMPSVTEVKIVDSWLPGIIEWKIVGACSNLRPSIRVKFVDSWLPFVTEVKIVDSWLPGIKKVCITNLNSLDQETQRLLTK